MTYEKISICPPELKELIEPLNLLPPDLNQFEDYLLKLSLEFNAECFENSESSFDLMDIYAEKICGLIHPELVNRINEFKKGDFINGKCQLERLINEKITLITVIQAFKAFKSFNNPSQTFGFKKSIAVFSFYKDSTIQLSSFRVIEVLTRNKIPIERVKICPICNEIFWAKRIEAQPCSKKRCSNNFHQRERRIKEYEKRLSKEVTNLEKLQLNLSPENTLISQQSNKTEKLSKKIKIEKRKNQFIY